uniref:Uncharacterized protein n=1 Tax=Arundo donax TaxID=35708 RepID=A0A0A9B307_ARUDO
MRRPSESSSLCPPASSTPIQRNLQGMGWGGG